MSITSQQAPLSSSPPPITDSALPPLASPSPMPVEQTATNAPHQPLVPTASTQPTQLQ